jgi:hypothetical protein
VAVGTRELTGSDHLIGAMKGAEARALARCRVGHADIPALGFCQVDIGSGLLQERFAVFPAPAVWLKILKRFWAQTTFADPSGQKTRSDHGGIPRVIYF